MLLLVGVFNITIKDLFETRSVLLVPLMIVSLSPGHKRF